MKKTSIALSLVIGLMSTAGHAECTPSDQWLIPRKDAHLNSKLFLPSLAPRGIILLGEHHANTEHHIWQLEIIKYFYAKEKSMAIGLEMLPRDRQAALDDWVAGKIDKDTFIEESHWFENWSFNFDDYYPLLEFAQQNQIPLIALNVSHELLFQVKNNGWDNIPDEQREGVGDPAPPETDYLRKLAKSFAQHNPGNQALDKNQFKNFVEQQLLWDRAMAEAIHTVYTEQKPKLVISLMGSWHIIDKQGVPYQLNAIGYPIVKTLVPWDENLDCDSVTSTFADGVYGVYKNP